MRPVTVVQYDFYKRRMPEIISKFPHLFNKRFPEPLAVGITQELAAATDFTEFEIGKLMYVWCGRHEYLCMATSVGYRLHLDGTIQLLDPVHMGHFQHAVGRLMPARVMKFANDFFNMYQYDAFGGFPAGENPFDKLGLKRPTGHKFDAKLAKATIVYNQDKTNATLFGAIYDDKKETGNHPFPNGTTVRTSRVEKVYCIAQVWFVKTENTVYRIVGELGNLDFDKRKFGKRVTTVTESDAQAEIKRIRNSLISGSV